jgi:glycosyltransferase involved in cell wall biosynthesis
MRVLVDAVMMKSPGGIQLRDELVRAIVESAPQNGSVILLVPAGACPLAASDTLRIITVDPPRGYWSGKWRWYNRILPDMAKSCQADIIYSLSGIVSKAMYKSFGIIGTTNNMLPFTPQRLQAYPQISKARLYYALLRHIIVSSLKKADAVVLHSRHALNMIMPYTGDISSKTVVVLTGVPRDMKFDRSASLPSHPYGGVPYFLYLSAIYSYKNHLNLIEAYRQALQEGTALPDLLIAGLPAEKEYLEKILSAIKEKNLENKVKYRGILDRKDIPAWLHYAQVNFLPSTCETGLIVVSEVLGVGGVLACSNLAPMPELASYAAELFDPYSIDSIKQAIVSLSRDPQRREELRNLASKRVAELSWTACGTGIWQAAMKAQTAFLNRKEK